VDAPVYIKPVGSPAMAYVQVRPTTRVRGLPSGRVIVSTRTRYADGQSWTPARSRWKVRLTTGKKSTVSVRFTNSGATAWQEPDWCSRLQPVADLGIRTQPFVGSGSTSDALLALAQRRYPPAVDFATPGSFDTDFFAVQGFTTWVHEMSHVLSTSTEVRPVVSATQLSLPHSTVETFPRSEILSRHPSPATDTYASTYLTADSGAQGFDSVLEEFSAYVHSLASSYCVRDLRADAGTSSSDRDGVLTFMLYAALYLRTAREDHPDVYQALVADEPTMQMLRLVWQRGQFYLDVTRPYTFLGINDRKLSGQLAAADVRAELDRVGLGR
jgi:hypothetical protein